MTCEEAQRLISGELDHENTPRETAALQQHLQTCQACAAVLESYRRTDLLLKELWQEPPADLCGEIMEQIRREGRRQPRRRKWHRGIMPSVAAAVVLLGIAVWKLPHWDNGSETAQMSRMAAEPAVMSLEEEPAYQGMDAQSPEELANTLGADVVVTGEILPELEPCVYENLPDGSVLYWLPTAQDAYEISMTYGLTLYAPAQYTDLDVSYALVCGQEAAP